MADREGRWSWGVDRDWTEDVWIRVIGPFFADYTRKTWGQIDAETTGPASRRRQKHTYYDFTMIKREAIRRLEALEIDDFAPDMFRFRISGLKRLYGFRVNPTFHFVWYDPTHEIIQPGRN
ncbi:MAG: hypothetical protein ACE5JZ_05475 [Kiloniellales bacterium]